MQMQKLKFYTSQYIKILQHCNLKILKFVYKYYTVRFHNHRRGVVQLEF